MAQYANQKTITTHREDALNSHKQYFAIISENLALASRILKPVAFKLYLYLAANRDGFIKDYSPRDFANIYGVSLDRARKAPQELMDAGYLVDENGKLHFYEVPKNTSHFSVKPQVRRFVDEDGVVFDYTYSQWTNAVKGAYSPSEIDILWDKAEMVMEVK